jgi:hypothetical protein
MILPYLIQMESKILGIIMIHVRNNPTAALDALYRNIETGEKIQPSDDW